MEKTIYTHGEIRLTDQSITIGGKKISLLNIREIVVARKVKLSYLAIPVLIGVALIFFGGWFLILIGIATIIAAALYYKKADGGSFFIEGNNFSTLYEFDFNSGFDYFRNLADKINEAKNSYSSK